MAGVDLTAQRLRELLDYNPETGVFTWRVRVGRVSPGELAGCNSHGYRVLRVDGRMYGGHRLAWFYVHGEWPKQVVDHINGVKSDNRICNLRDTSPSLNNLNCSRPRRHNATSPYLGVTKPARNKRYSAKIAMGRRVYLLGCYETAEEARDVYEAAKRKIENNLPPI